jgi:hypothetical protein
MLGEYCSGSPNHVRPRGWRSSFRQVVGELSGPRHQPGAQRRLTGTVRMASLNVRSRNAQPAIARKVAASTAFFRLRPPACAAIHSLERRDLVDLLWPMTLRWYS